MTPVIETHQLARRYGPRIGVDGIDLRIEPGEVFGFLGPNGAGKTTFIRVLLGFLRPTSGGARIFGRDCWHDSRAIKREVGYLPGDVRLYPWLTVRRAVGIIQAAHRGDFQGPGRDLAARLDIDPDLPVRKMSRGMRQKLALIIALVHGPKLLVLDEPTSALDPLVQITLADLLRQRCRAGVTVFFSSHTLSEVEHLCDRVAVVRKGRIVADEPIDDLRKRARREVVIRFESAAAAAAAEPPPDGLTVIERDGDRWRAELAGEAGALRQWLARQPVRDLMIGPPDLRTIFHAYYRETEDLD